MAQSHQFLFNHSLRESSGEEAPGREAARVVVGVGVGHAVPLVGVEHPIIGDLIVLVDVAGPPTDVPGVELTLLRFRLRVLLQYIRTDLDTLKLIWSLQSQELVPTLTML